MRPWERAVVVRSGALDRTADAGRYRRRRHEVWHIVDLRPRWLTLATQEVLTADGLQVRVTPVALFRVVDPTAWLTEADEPTAALYTLAQLALRDALTGKALDEVLAARDGLLDEANGAAGGGRGPSGRGAPGVPRARRHPAGGAPLRVLGDGTCQGGGSREARASSG